MLGGELTFFFWLTIVVAALVAPFVLWRYAAVVLKGMGSSPGAEIPVLEIRAALPPSTGPANEASLTRWEHSTHRRVAAAWLLSVGIAALLLSLAYILASGFPMTPAHVVLVLAIMLNAAVPMIAVSLGWSWTKGVRFWLVMLVAGALISFAASVLQRLLTGRAPSLDQAMNLVFYFQLAYTLLFTPFLLLVASGWSRVRGVFPALFAGLVLFAVAPFLGSHLLNDMAGTAWGSKAMLGSDMLGSRHVIFAALALPVGWVAWKRIQSLASAYDAKRFSDVQLLARAWWLMFAATLAIEIVAVSPDNWLGALACMGAYAVFVPVNARAFAWVRAVRDAPPPRTLLLLRVFGYTARTEKLFDRIGARWRYFGPVTMIAAPDVVARTLDPADFLNYLLGTVDETFVRSSEELQRRLAAFDNGRDPDGRFRVNEFCCADSTWRATVLQLMGGADAVLMDLRGVAAGRLGCEFELQQLSVRVDPSRIVLVVDAATDRALVNAALGSAAPRVGVHEIARASFRTPSHEALFRQLLAAAH